VRFKDLPVGLYELRVGARDAWREWRGTLDLSASSGALRRFAGLATLEIRLWAEQGILSGRLVGPDGLPVADAAIALTTGREDQRQGRAAPLLGFCERTDGQGRFELPRCADVAQQELLICPRRAGLPVLHFRLLGKAELDGTEPIEILLPRAIRARLSVLGADGNPAPGRLCLQRDGAFLPPDCEDRLAHLPGLDAARQAQRAPGRLELDIAPGHYVLHYRPDDPAAKLSLFSFELSSESVAEFEFRLEP
jgi:hypothetical protein